MKGILVVMGVTTLILFGPAVTSGDIILAASCAVSTLLSFCLLYFWHDEDDE